MSWQSKPLLDLETKAKTRESANFQNSQGPQIFFVESEVVRRQVIWGSQ